MCTCMYQCIPPTYGGQRTISYQTSSSTLSEAGSLLACFHVHLVSASLPPSETEITDGYDHVSPPVGSAYQNSASVQPKEPSCQPPLHPHKPTAVVKVPAILPASFASCLLITQSACPTPCPSSSP